MWPPICEECFFLNSFVTDYVPLPIATTHWCSSDSNGEWGTLLPSQWQSLPSFTIRTAYYALLRLTTESALNAHFYNVYMFVGNISPCCIHIKVQIALNICILILGQTSATYHKHVFDEGRYIPTHTMGVPCS